MFFNQYPYINMNDLNLDFLLNAIKDMKYEVDNFVSINAIKYADPIQWDITRQYEKNTIVIDPVTGTAYISVAAVPSGVALTRPEFWTVVFDLGSFVTRAAQNFTDHWESDTTLTATFSTPVNGWLVWGDVLYKALVNITAGDAYVVGSNIEHFTMEDLYTAMSQEIANEVQAREDADNALQTAIDNEVTAREDADNALQTAIDNEVTAREGADNALQTAIEAIQNNMGDLDGLLTDYKSNLVGAINEVDALAKAGGTGYINVKNYGAVGDGITDDTQAFINALADGTGIYVPTGKYLITQPLNLAKKKRVFLGDGASNTILIDGITTAGHTFIIVDNSDVPDSDPHFLTDLDIGRFGIIGNADCSIGFHVNGTAHSMYHDIICTNLDKADAIAFKVCSLICSYKNLKVHFMDVDDYQGHEADYGVYIDLCEHVGGSEFIPAVNNTFYDCYFTYSSKYGIYIRRGSVNRFYNCVAESNTIRNVYIATADATYKTNMNSFIGCAFEDAPMCVEDYGSNSVYIDTYFNTYPHVDQTTDVSCYIRGANAKFYGCIFMTTPILFGFGSSSSLFGCTLDKQYRNAGDIDVLSYNSHYSDGTLLTFDAGYFSFGTYANGTYTATNYFKDILAVNVLGHNPLSDWINITTAAGQVTQTRGYSFILYPGDRVSITSSSAMAGYARHMSTN